jgi:hypothetical protein
MANSFVVVDLVVAGGPERKIEDVHVNSVTSVDP